MLFKNILPAIIWSLIILGLTLSPGSSIPNVQIAGIDKAVHIILFGTLMFLFLRGLRKQKQTKAFTGIPLLISFIFCLSYGILIECIQVFVPGEAFLFMI
jgi:hypothetical protein